MKNKLAQSNDRANFAFIIFRLERFSGGFNFDLQSIWTIFIFQNVDDDDVSRYQS
jgi:hypothetical protein